MGVSNFYFLSKFDVFCFLRTPENYEILTKLGRGRYSEVFEVLYK